MSHKMSYRKKLLSSALVPLALGVGTPLATIPAVLAGTALFAQAANPCAPKANPCAAKANPCGAQNPCSAQSNPCSAGGASTPPQLTNADAIKDYKSLQKDMKAAYAKSGLKDATAYSVWKRYNKEPYLSATHGQRYVNNYANPKAKAYGKFEKAGVLPPGSVLAKDSFVAAPGGKLSAGPLFLMEKMKAGFDKGTRDWRYSMVMPDGSIYGMTNGKDSANVQFCADCHNIKAETDALYFVPEEHRAKK